MPLVMTLTTSIDIPRLPVELLRPIFEHLKGERSSLCALALSSACMRPEAQRVLFRDVGILQTDDKLLIFLRIICEPSKKNLALLVHACGLVPQNSDDSLRRKLSSGLKVMRNLKRLVIRLPTYFQVPEFVQALCRCSFKLELLDWKCPSSSDTANLIQNFLPKQEHLKHLRLSSYSTDLHTPPLLTIRACPQLVSLVGKWDIIQAFLPEHHITTVHFKIEAGATPTPNSVDMMLLQPAWQQVRALALSATSLRSGQRDLMLRAFQSLIVIEIFGFDETKELSILNELPALQTLILPTYNFYFRRRNSPESDQQIIDAIFDNSSMNLERIDMQLDIGMFGRFTRSQPDVMQMVEESEVRKWWLP